MLTSMLSNKAVTSYRTWENFGMEKIGEFGKLWPIQIFVKDIPECISGMPYWL